MAKARGFRRSKKNAANAPQGADTASALAPKPRVEVPVWRDFIVALMVLVAIAATIFIWLDEPRPTFEFGFLATDLVWIATLLGVLGRIQARRAVRTLQAIVNHEVVISATIDQQISEDQTGLRMRHVSGWMSFGLGVVATIVLWQTDAIANQLGGLSTLAVGVTVSVMFGLSIAANTLNRLKTKRLTRDLRDALNHHHYAVGTLESLQVLISSCLPTGERTRFNEHFINLAGRSAEALHGNGWLEVVHPEYRQGVVEIASRPLITKRSREHTFCIRRPDGQIAWIHESLMPRCNEKGELIEYIGTAINITQFVENESSLDKQLGTLKTEMEKLALELGEARNELSKTKTSRNRFEKSLEDARDDVKNLQATLDKAEATVEKTRMEAAAKINEIKAEADDQVRAAEEAAAKHIVKVEQATEAQIAKLEEALKLARTEMQGATAENKKLVRAFEKIQEEIAQIRQENGDLREQMTRHIKETREAKAESVEAHKNEAQHRAKADRLTQRCEEVEKELAAVKSTVAQAKSQADKAGIEAAAEVERRLHEVSAEALASHLRKQLDGMQRMTSELLATGLDGPSKDAAYNAAATVRTMSDLVDQALVGSAASKGKNGRVPKGRILSAAATSFDLKRTASGVRDLLSDAAAARGVKVETEFAKNLPSLVHGEDLEIRTAMFALADAAMNLVQDGGLTIRLSEDVSTGAHSTIRCEINHASARIKTDAFEAALALKSNDDAMPDPTKQPMAYQAAKALRTIRQLQGQHGYMLPDSGGFSVWFTFVVGRPAAAATGSGSHSLRSALSAIGGPGTASTAVPARPVYASPQAVLGAPVTNVTAAAAALANSDPNVTRQMPRVPQEELNCSLGEVVELGADSIRVFCSKPPKRNETTITFDDVETDMELRAEVIWSKKLSRGRHDVGLKFLGLTSEEQRRILAIVMQHRKITTMTDGDE
jgi:PAS domain S-box-containing protein